MGLAAVGGILRTQSGSLEVRSILGAGSTFRVYLPASSPRAIRPPEASVDYRNVRGQGTILVVDDEEMIRNIARQMLEDAGFTVLLANGGEAAIRILETAGDTPISLIILDLSMPEFSGRQVMQAIRRAGIEIPILICSGYTESEISKEFSGLHIAGVITKPFTLRQLANRVHRVLGSKGSPV